MRYFYFKKALNWLLDFVFPRNCIGCEKEGLWLCLDCLEKIPLENRIFCTLCKKPYLGFIPQCKCRSPLKGVWCLTSYQDLTVQKLIWLFKYQGIENLKYIFWYLQGKYLQNLPPVFQFLFYNSLFVPVPLTRIRKAERGFNQSFILAQGWQNLTQGKILEIIKKTKNTPAQVELDRLSRCKNLKNAFQIKKPLKKIESRIFIVDDVITTGATLIECALVLKKLKCPEIWGLVFACD